MRIDAAVGAYRDIGPIGLLVNNAICQRRRRTLVPEQG